MCPFSTFLFNTTLKILNSTVIRKRNKSRINGNEKIKTNQPLLANDMTVYIEHLKEVTDKLLH